MFPSPVALVKSHEKKCWNYFSKYQYHYGMVKCHRNVNFEEMDIECPTGKNYGFWVLRGIFNEYIKQNIIMAVLRKSNSHSIVICRLRSKINNEKEDPRRKTTQIFGFSQAAQCLWGFNEKECYIVGIIELLLHQKRLKLVILIE